MAQTIKTRIQHKHDIEANWIKATNFVPLVGELIIYDAETQETFDIAYATLNDEQKVRLNRTEPITKQRFKFGDGTTNVNELPFASNEEQIQANWLQKDETKADYIKNKPENLLTASDAIKFGGYLRYNNEFGSSDYNYWMISPSRALINEIDKSLLNYDRVEACIVEDASQPTIRMQGFTTIYDEEGYHDGEESSEVIEKVIPNNYCFDVDEIFHYGETDDEGNELVRPEIILGYTVSVGDTLYTHLQSWKLDTHTDARDIGLKVDAKLDKTPDGHNDLITNENKIGLTYLPNELVRGKDRIFGGTFWLHYTDTAEFDPTAEAIAMCGFRENYEWCSVSTNFSVSMNGYDEYGEYFSDDYVNGITEDFYYELQGVGGDSFGGIMVPEEGTIYIRRVGDHWEAGSGSVSVVVTNTVNGQSGDVVLTAENITVSADSNETIKSQLDKIDASLKFGGNLEHRGDEGDPFGYWHVSLDDGTYNISDTNPPMWYNRDAVSSDEATPVPEGTFFVYTYGYSFDWGEEEQATTIGFGDFEITIGDWVVVKDGIWQKANSTELVKQKLDKAPNGTDNLITEKNKIALTYLPNELVHTTNISYGGEIVTDGSGDGYFYPTPEFISFTDIPYYDGAHCKISPDFAVDLDGTIYGDVILENFYFHTYPDTDGAGYSFAGFEDAYIRRAGDLWVEYDETTDTISKITVVNTINGQNGDITLTAENLPIAPSADETVGETLTTIKEDLDSALKYGGNLEFKEDESGWQVYNEETYEVMPVDEYYPQVNYEEVQENTFFIFTGGYYYPDGGDGPLKEVTIRTFGNFELTVGDWIVARNSTWEKIDYTPEQFNPSELERQISNKLDKAPNGYSNLLDENKKINFDYLPDTVVGQLRFGGTLSYSTEYDSYNWRAYYSDMFKSAVKNIASSINNYEFVDIINGNPPYFEPHLDGTSSGDIPEGFYFIVGALTSTDENGNTINLETATLADTEYSVGDWALVSNKTWRKVDNTDAVRTVNGKIGNVVLTGEDIAISTDNNTTVKEYIDSKEDKDTTYTLYGSTNDPGLIYLKDNVTNYTKEVDLRRTTVVGDRYGVSATGHYKFLSGKLSDYQDANYLLFVNSTVSGSKGGLIHVHIRRDNGSFRAPVLGWLSKTSGMEENCIGVVQDKDTGDYALYLYRSGTYTYTFVEVLSASSSIGRTNISYTLYNTQEPEDIEMNYTSKNIGVVETAIKDSAGNDIVSTYYNSKTSRTANTFLAAPDGSNGAATFRKISVDDLPQSYVTDIAVEESTLTYTRGDGTTQSVELPSGGGDSELANKVTELEAKVAQLEAIINNITTLNVSNTSGQLNINE